MTPSRVDSFNARPLHLTYAIAPGGGAETYALQIAEALGRRGHRISIVYLCSPGEQCPPRSTGDAVRIEQARISNGHYYYARMIDLLPGSARVSLWGGAIVKAAEATLALRAALNRIRRVAGPIDLLEVPEEIAFPSLLDSSVPYAVKLHSSDATWRHFCGEGLRRDDRHRVHLEEKLLRRASLISAPSAAVADHISSACHFPRERIAVVPYPLDTDRFSPGDESLRRQSVLYVGRLDARKGLNALARGAETILRAAPEATIDIVGGETPEVTAASLLVHIPVVLHHRVRFHGRVPHDRLPDYYRRAAVCVVPSRWDNSPNTIYEAMGCGVPVVASAVGGIPELVADGETGFLVSPDDPAALADRVVTLLRGPSRAATFGQSARSVALARFTTSIIASCSEEIYRSALRRDTRSATTLAEEGCHAHP
jgi:glycosyltransferase involved in cell wall biosynthesis